MLFASPILGERIRGMSWFAIRGKRDVAPEMGQE